jgi:hypothetical protein
VTTGCVSRLAAVLAFLLQPPETVGGSVVALQRVSWPPPLIGEPVYGRDALGSAGSCLTLRTHADQVSFVGGGASGGGPVVVGGSGVGDRLLDDEIGWWGS